MLEQAGREWALSIMNITVVDSAIYRRVLKKRRVDFQSILHDSFPSDKYYGDMNVPVGCARVGAC